MFFLPMGVLIRDQGSDEFFASSGTAASDYPDVSWANAIVDNLLPVTIGNVIGGAVMVGLVYWLVYVRTER
jgi:formate transporter